jgi:hypothetical protein
MIVSFLRLRWSGGILIAGDMISWHRSTLPMVESSPWMRHSPSFDGFRGSAAPCARYFPSFGGFRWPDTGVGTTRR